jgi:hypothetical protein
MPVRLLFPHSALLRDSYCSANTSYTPYTPYSFIVKLFTQVTQQVTQCVASALRLDLWSSSNMARSTEFMQFKGRAAPAIRWKTRERSSVMTPGCLAMRSRISTANRGSDCDTVPNVCSSFSGRQ